MSNCNGNSKFQKKTIFRHAHPAEFLKNNESLQKLHTRRAGQTQTDTDAGTTGRMMWCTATVVAASLLHDAVRRSNATAVGLALDAGASLMEKDRQGYTALHRASDDGELEIATLLIKSGARVDARDNDFATPLHLAATSGASAVVKLLMQHGASTEVTDSMGNDALHRAAEGGHAMVLRLLLSVPAGARKRRNDAGKTALDVAMQWGWREAAAVLGGPALAGRGNSSPRTMHMPLNMQPARLALGRRKKRQPRKQKPTAHTVRADGGGAHGRLETVSAGERTHSAGDDAAITFRAVATSRIGIEEDNLTP